MEQDTHPCRLPLCHFYWAPGQYARSKGKTACLLVVYRLQDCRFPALYFVYRAHVPVHHHPREFEYHPLGIRKLPEEDFSFRPHLDAGHAVNGSL